MKQKIHTYILFITLLLLNISCNESFLDNLDREKDESTLSESICKIRSIEDASKIALLIKCGSDDSKTRVSDSNILQSVIPIVSNSTRSGSDTLLYIVEYTGNDGFAIISARKDVEPILAVIDQGDYTSEQTSTNQSFQNVFIKIMDYASKTSPTVIKYSSTVPPHPELQPGYYDTISPGPKKEPLVKVSWGQEWPEGIYCPNKIAGCGPIAAAQIMSAMKKPTSISYSFNEIDISYETIEWNNIVKHKKNRFIYSACSSNFCEATDEVHKTIARIARQIGEMSHATYIMNPPATSTYALNVVNTITSLTGIDVVSEGNTPLSLYKTLNSSLSHLSTVTHDKVAYVRGTNTISSDGTYNRDGSGHAWVADGTWELGLTIRYWNIAATTDPSQPSIMTPTIIRESAKYIHFNWGWNGNCNGYFLVDVLNPNKAYEYDDSVGLNYVSQSSYDGDFAYYAFKVK